MNETDYTKIGNARLKQMVKELYPLREKFNDFEYRLITNLKNFSGQFSERQKFNVVRIYNKYFPDGIAAASHRVNSGENFDK